MAADCCSELAACTAVVNVTVAFSIFSVTEVTVGTIVVGAVSDGVGCGFDPVVLS